jgi:hypothetical protein
VTELELQLLALRDEVAWPPTPDLATTVQARVAREPASSGRRGRRDWSRGRLVPALVAVLVACSPRRAARASPAFARRARLARDRLGAHRARPDLPDISRPAGSSSAAARRWPRPTPPGQPDRDGPRLGRPAAIYIDDGPPPRVSEVYAARPGSRPGSRAWARCSTRCRATRRPSSRSSSPAACRSRRARQRAARVLHRQPARGHAPDELRPRIAGNTVVWLHDAITYRLETKLGRAAAVRLAETVG